jgi:polysaccharide deacetylase family protein (PEP-CTERM system associated)
VTSCQQINYLSIDVEDYFQVSAFEAVSQPESWDARPLRVERNTEKILELLAERNVKATFFILGWVAARCPGLVQRIAAAGHEVASHGYRYQRLTTLARAEFRHDIRSSKCLLESLSGQPVHGYRAPSYSISAATPWAFDELLDAGYTYDSSIFPIVHDLYGIRDWPRFTRYAVKTKDGSWQTVERPVDGQPFLMEVPISTLNLAGRNLPIAGGGYFRLFPYAVTRWGLQRINRQERKPFTFYLHPWEFDPAQPKMQGAGWKSNFRHYLNLCKTESRFKRLLVDFDFTTISAGLAVGA